MIQVVCLPHIVPLVFVCPPAGKPNPQLMPPVGDAVDTRPRVLQRGSKGYPSWHYAYSVLRTRQG